VLSDTAQTWTYAWSESSPNPEGITAAGTPGADAGNGNGIYSAPLDVSDYYSEDGAGVYWTANFFRVNAAGVIQVQAGINGFVQGNGLFAASGSLDLGTFSAGDRFRVRHWFSPESLKGAVSMTLNFSASSGVVSAPWTLTPPAPARRPIRTMSLMRY